MYILDYTTIYQYGLTLSGHSFSIVMDLFQIVHNAEEVPLDIPLAFTA